MTKTARSRNAFCRTSAVPYFTITFWYSVIHPGLSRVLSHSFTTISFRLKTATSSPLIFSYAIMPILFSAKGSRAAPIFWVLEAVILEAAPRLHRSSSRNARAHQGELTHARNPSTSTSVTIRSMEKVTPAETARSKR